MTTSETATDRSRRKVKNILIRPRQQLRHTLFLAGGGIAICGVSTVLLLIFLHQMFMDLITAYAIDGAVSDTIQTSLKSSIVFVGVICTVLGILTIVTGVVTSHRIFGPAVPIKQLIEKLKNGDYTARGTLRTKDEFQDVMEALNDLAETLEKKS